MISFNIFGSCPSAMLTLYLSLLLTLHREFANASAIYVEPDIYIFTGVLTSGYSYFTSLSYF